MYSKLPHARSRGVAAEHAALSRPRSRVRIPSGPHEKCNKYNQETKTLIVLFFLYIYSVYIFILVNISSVLVRQYMVRFDIYLHNLTHTQLPRHLEYQNQDNL